METINRITPDVVVAAYKACGMTPSQGIFCEDGKCCALSAVAIANGIPVESISACMGFVFMAAIKPLGLHRYYVTGFISGFDAPHLNVWDMCSKESQNGCNDGRAAAIRMGLFSPKVAEE